MRIGFDVDGVLADFNQRYVQRCAQVTGENKFPPWPFPITSWNYARDFGYSAIQEALVWDSIIADPNFWMWLDPYLSTEKILSLLRQLSADHDVYFITSRPGIKAKWQTEAWLQNNGFDADPTVLISYQKGLCAQALNLDIYFDDKDENVQDVMRSRTECQVYLVDRTWNHEQLGVAMILEEKIVDVLKELQ